MNKATGTDTHSAMGPSVDRRIMERLAELARVPVLLVTSDYDGTLAPIVNNPADARPHREAMVALHNLAILPRTHVAIVSGRSLRDLAELTGEPGNVHLVGSHGSEFDPDFAARLPREAIELRERLLTELTAIADRSPGCTVETKPASIAFHYRNAEADTGSSAAEEVRTGPASWPGVNTKIGKKVIELGVIEADKGMALDALRHRTGASAALFLGDDVTDEDAFATLRGPDVGIKVGAGESCADWRISDPADVAFVLAQLAEMRADAIGGGESTPISAHSMLSDQRTIALVDSNARITWMCAPRIDSASLFSELLGGPNAGFFAVEPVSDVANASSPSLPHQQYIDGTLILRSAWPDVCVTDYLDASGGLPAEPAEEVHLMRVLEGTGKARITFAPRLDFGQAATKLKRTEHGLVVSEVIDAVALHAPGIEWEIEDDGEHQSATAEVDLAQGPFELHLRWGTTDCSPWAIKERARRDETATFWSHWLETLDLPRLHHEAMRTSALILKGLVHGPSGAIAAAGTTSLPETIGGVRNWDYRFCWPRDASMAAATLVRSGSTGEATALLDWLSRIVQQTGSADRLAPIYTVTGQETPTEAELAHLSGYAASRPVRIGNAAARQVQLDVFGPIADLLWELHQCEGHLSPNHHHLVQSMATAVRHRWREPDHGIWEIRGPLQHHVHTKVMCWLTMDRAARIAQASGVAGGARLAEIADTIRDDVLEHGWNESLNAFGASYGGSELDAAVLTIGLSGLLDPADDRFVSTVNAVEEHLREGPTVYRYLYDDGLPGREGGFHICGLWLVESLALIGQTKRAKSMLDEIAACIGPTGLLSEQHDPRSDTPLGNHPQAYSHLALIDAARRIERLI